MLSLLIGRDRELDSLDQLLEDASAGRGGLRVLCGAPGIGKTRLADELSARAAARSFTVAWGRAWETGGAPAYWPWIELLGPLAEACADVPPRVAALLDRAQATESVEGTRADPARERFELFEAVGSFLRTASRRAPILLTFDDLHAADVASLELLAFVARGLRASRIAVLATCRDAESRLAPVVEVLSRISREGSVLSLRPLSGEDVAEIVRQDTGHFDAPLAAALFDLTEGNPLFLRESLHVVAAGSFASPIDALRDIGVAGGVLGVVRSRLGGADGSLRALLEAASVLGRDVSLALLTQSAGQTLEEVQRGLEEAARRGLLLQRGEDHFTFSHVLVREAFYREMPESRRSALHATVKSALERRVALGAEDQLSTIAHHALLSLPSGDPIDAIRTARMAADAARAQLGYEEAITLLERALSTCERFGVPDVERAEVELALGWAATEAGEFERGRDLVRGVARIARAAGNARLLARAALAQGAQYVLAEIRGELVDVLREALAALGEPDDVEDTRLRARVLARLAAALTPSATPDEPLRLARAALAMTLNETDARTRIDVDVGVGAALTDFAPPEERIPVNERLLRDARTVGDRVLRLRALTRLACDYFERGDVAAVDAAIAARADLADAIGHPRYQWATPLMRSMRAMPDGRFDDCEAEIAEARRIAAEVSDPNAERCIEFHRFSMLLAAGRTQDLVAQQAAALRVVGSLPDALWLPTLIMAAVASRLGDHQSAARPLRALGAGAALAARTARASLADAALWSRVPEVYEPVYRTFGEDEALVSWGPFAFAGLPPVARLLGAIDFARGRTDEAVRHCERALSVSTRMDAAAHLAWVHLTWGEGLQQHPEAREHLECAARVAEKLRMPEVLARAQAAMAERTTQPPRAAPAAVPVFSLVRDASGWSVSHAGRSFHVKDIRGLGMLAQLVQSPDRELHVLDLAADPVPPGAVMDLGDSGEVLDAKARDAYKARIVDLREEVQEAESFADNARAERLRYELDALTDQIAGAVGLGGRERRSGSAAERARIVVQRRVREAIKKIAEHDPQLGRHLDWTVRTGTFCAYEPQGRRGTH